jgi:ribosomal-protein-alanine N-acetyltransferase
MTMDDLAAVHALECAAQHTPWGLQHFVDELRNPFSHIDLCWYDGELAGFLCWWLVAGEVQIQNVATAPAFRRQGVATRLLAKVLEQVDKNDFEAVWLEVRISNAAAITLYERFGFREVARRSGYYADGEAALVMCYRPE